MLARIKYYLADINTDDDHFALDTILRVGTGGEFLTQMHTARHCRTDPFTSDISLQGRLKGGTTANDAFFSKMSKKIETMLSSYVRPEETEDLLARLDNCMKDIGIDPVEVKQKVKIPT